MKKLLFSIIVLVISVTYIQAQVPDELCVTVQDSVICFPTGDAQAAGDIISNFVSQNKGNWPTSTTGWFGLLVAFILSAPGIALVSRVKNIYSLLKRILGKTLHVVAFVAGLFAAGVTYLFGALGGNGFDWGMFLSIWGPLAFLAVVVYHRWIEKKADIITRAANARK